MVIFKNYDLVECQIKNFEKISGNWRLLIGDSTPSNQKKSLKNLESEKIKIYDIPINGIDGEIHGGALDFLKQKSKSSIIGTCDSDFFWVKKNILNQVTDKFNDGHACVGTELWYPCDGIVEFNRIYPERAGHLTPCVFGMFIERSLAMSETFIVTKKEALEKKETGWRLREKLINNKIKTYVYPGHLGLNESVIHKDKNEIIGFHLVKGSSSRRNTNHLLNEIKKKHLIKI